MLQWPPQSVQNDYNFEDINIDNFEVVYRPTPAEPCQLPQRC